MAGSLYMRYWSPSKCINYLREYILRAIRPSVGKESKESNQSDKRPWKIIEVGGVPNLRGFGGYPTELSRSHKTRKMFLYRSAHPGRLTEAGLNKLKDMGIKNIIDLTSDNETVVNYNISLERLTNEGLLRISCPLKRGLFSIDELLSRYGNYTTKDCEVKSISKRYVGLLEEGAETVRKILSILCSNPRSATLIHCSLGKDRTGIIFALLLLLAGVPDPLIAMEYSVSTEGLKGSVVDIEKFLRENTNSDALSRARALEMATAKEDTMTETIRVINMVYGGASQYLMNRCGYTKGDVAKFRAMLLEEE